MGRNCKSFVASLCGVLLLLGGVTGSSVAQQQSARERLKQQYKGKILSLKTPQRGTYLKFDSSGVLLGKAERGTWTADANLLIDAISLKQDRLEISGARVMYLWDAKQQQMVGSRLNSSLTVEIGFRSTSAAPGGEEAISALNRVFQTRKEVQSHACSAQEQDAFKGRASSLVSIATKGKDKAKAALIEAASGEPRMLCFPSGTRAYMSSTVRSSLPKRY